MKTIWSCGGGTQSAAIAVLIIQGRLPKPDLTVMIDTERERSSTWTYLREWIQPGLAAVGVDLQVVPKSAYATVDLWSTKGTSVLLPGFTSANGHKGKLPTYCSKEWKLSVIQRWARAQGVKKAQCWIGMSLDEVERMRVSDLKWWENHYPLCYDVPMRRKDCVALVKAHGWPSPPRSSCWMCPNMGDREWKEIRDHSPEDWQRAIELERSVREKDPHFYLHRQCIPLADVNFDAQLDLFGECASGLCFV